MNQTTSANTMGLRTLFQSKDIGIAAALVLIVGLMIVPLPPVLLDLLVALNLALAVGIILLTVYIAKPTDFAAFPTVLLLVTLFRLGINISASRLILLDGDAGKVIGAFGNMIVGGNYVVGVVVFIMMMIIQFVVINNGAGRVAEVAARFTLDAMPGKQLAIDADLNAGMIDEEQARKRRREIEMEADFYGSMDGSSKFVRGDAIAAIVIMLVNIIGGFVIGIVQAGMPFMDALQAYTLLTVGAGLAIQIPALLISAAAGLLVTRSDSGVSFGADLTNQLSNVNALAMGAVITAAMTIIPGMPRLPFLLIAALLAGGAFLAWNSQQAPVESPVAEVETEPESPQAVLEMVVVDPLELEVGYAIIPLIDESQSDNLLHRITTIRRQIMTELGLVLPIVRVRDNLRLAPSAYRIKIRGEEAAIGELVLDRHLAIPGAEVSGELKGIETTEPAFGLPSLWISEADTGRAELMGYTVVSPLSVLVTHLTEVVRANAGDLLGRQIVQDMLKQLHERAPAAVDGLIPDSLSLSDLQAVLRNLLRERIPIRDLAGILEVLGKNAGATRDPNILAEAVRQTMARTISNRYRDPDGCLHVFTLSPQLESVLRDSLSSSDNGFGFNIDPALAQTIIVRTGEQMEKVAQSGYFPILICPREIRLAFQRLVERSIPNLVVLAFSEVSGGTRVQAHGMVEVS
ncbi:MAG TPA: flagellar biosynthesis protein FlhA [Anaerolineales bacterium]|nr:flagellar biosynthesis protein FlhA [Anaerolineales bacterium]